MKLQECQLSAAAGKLRQIFSTPNSSCVCLCYLYMELADKFYTCD